MDDEFITKMLTLGLWVVLIVLTFVIGLPLAHAVSVVDTACFQASQVAQTNGSVTDIVSEAVSIIESQNPTTMGATVLFDPSNSVQVESLGQGVEKISVTYDAPVFGPIVHMFGLSGPTIPITDTKTITASSAAEQGVPYSQ